MFVRIFEFIFLFLSDPRNEYLPTTENKHMRIIKKEIPKIYPLFFVVWDNRYARIGMNAKKASRYIKIITLFF